MYKQVIVFRSDLGMGRGKLAVQVAHASLEAYKSADKRVREEWDREGSKKVVVKAESLRKLQDIYRKAVEAGLPCSLVRDAGRTELPHSTITCVGIGPGKEEDIDKLTRELKLV